MNKIRILLFAHHTISVNSRSGIQRVAVNLARSLPMVATLDVVKWDGSANQLRYADRSDLARLFGSATLPAGIEINRFAHRIDYRFGDTIDPSIPTWLIQPEISYHKENGNVVFAKILSQCQEYNIKTASIFYDNIPIGNNNYAMYKNLHTQYVNLISKCDEIFSISHHSGKVLTDYFRRHAMSGDDETASIAAIRPVLLPDSEGRTASSVQQATLPRDSILAIGTVEPRKQQINIIRAFQSLKENELAGLRLIIVGSLHPDVSDEFHALIRHDYRISYHGYLDDDAIECLYQTASFSVFASNDEGYGLPIAESLARNVPVICAGFGSMAEVAEGGGCLQLDVNDVSILARGMALLGANPALRQELVDQIARRPFRSWVNYAQEICTILAERSPHAASVRDRAILRRCLTDAFAPAGSAQVTRQQVALSCGTIEICRIPMISADAAGAMETLGSMPKLGPRVNCLNGDLAALRDWPAAALHSLLGADALIATDTNLPLALIEAAERNGFDELLPHHICASASSSEFYDLESEALLDLLGRKNRLATIGAKETNYLKLTGSTRPAYAEMSGPLLTIIVSTFNRGPFLLENVRWLLGLTAKFQGDVAIAVLDNVSTDDSWDRLQAEFGNERVRLLRNITNVGMLGNLRQCAAAVSSPFVWMVGDDDYIVPSELGSILAVLREHPGLPLVLVNFGVYYRDNFSVDDHAERFIAEQVKLAPEPRPSGLYKVAAIATEHDNLFTAIYPIIFRNDLAAACFNYPFRGAPFSNLVESIPTTKLILESYADAPCYWHAPIGIVGNGVNSWSRWRMRWHGAIMAETLALADIANIDSKTLYRWSKVQWDLFTEAKTQFPDENFAATVGPTALERSSHIFRQKLV